MMTTARPAMPPMSGRERGFFVALSDRTVLASMAEARCALLSYTTSRATALSPSPLRTLSSSGTVNVTYVSPAAVAVPSMCSA